MENNTAFILRITKLIDPVINSIISNKFENTTKEI